MINNLSLKRAAFAALFILSLSSCGSGSRWSSGSICTPCPSYSSTILSYDPECHPTGIGFERLRTCSGVRYYLNLYSCPLRDEVVAVETSCCSDTVNGVVLRGGQRIWLPETLGEAIMKSLDSGEAVTVAVGNYCETLPPLMISCAE